MDANDLQKKETTRFKEFRENIILGDFYYQQNDINSAIKSYFSALKIDNTYYNILLKIYMTFSAAKFTNSDKKKNEGNLFIFLEQKNICHRYGFENFLKFTVYNEK